MEDLLISYFAYNLVVGLALVVFYFIKGQNELSPKQMVWLLIYPSAGLGKWRYLQAMKEFGYTEFPEKWYMWKYMMKVHWGYLVLLGFFPVLLLLAMMVGITVGGMPDLASIGEMEAFIGLGVVLLIFLSLIFTVFLLIIPYLLLIYLPKMQMQQIERDVYNQLRQEKMAQMSAQGPMKPKETVARSIPLFKDVELYVRKRVDGYAEIPRERKKELEALATLIGTKLTSGASVNLVFICTHNSRRSQFGQVWASVAAAYFGIRNIQTYSGGTEETAFNKRAVAAIERAGLLVKGTVGTNPRYSVRFSEETGALDCYSKTFDNPANPQRGFMAIMTCSDADENCPVILGAENRVKLTYDDPKIADNTSSETALYDERCAQIASEMLYLFSKV